jgi:hypothetical protein
VSFEPLSFSIYWAVPFYMIGKRNPCNTRSNHWERGGYSVKNCVLIIVAAIAALSVGGCFGKGKAPPPAAPPVITKG